MPRGDELLLPVTHKHHSHTVVQALLCLGTSEVLNEKKCKCGKENSGKNRKGKTRNESRGRRRKTKRREERYKTCPSGDRR